MKAILGKILKYEIRNFVNCITDCPFGTINQLKSALSGEMKYIKVGSVGCKNCKDHLLNDRDKNKVLCKNNNINTPDGKDLKNSSN